MVTFNLSCSTLSCKSASTNAIPEKVDKDKRKSEQREEKSDKHIWGHVETSLPFRVGSANDYRMDRTEQADREEGDWCTEATNESIYRAETARRSGSSIP